MQYCPNCKSTYDPADEGQHTPLCEACGSDGHALCQHREAEAAMKRSPFDESALRLQDSITARRLRNAQWWMRVETAADRTVSHATEKTGTVTLCGQPVSFPLGGADMPTCEECAYAVMKETTARDLAQMEFERAAARAAVRRLREADRPLSDIESTRQPTKPPARVTYVPVSCSWVVRLGTLETPPEHCDEDALPDDDYCAAHQEKANAMDEWEKRQ